MTLTIRPATSADLKPSAELLAAAGLPVADLSVDRLAFVAEKEEMFQGVIGLERYGNKALLRSLAVASEARGSGIGPALVTALEVACIADGVQELWLLTIDAEPFFASLGYGVRLRTEAPDEIRNTAEYSALCPDDAVLMSKQLQHFDP